MNFSMQDTFNLGWKLASVLRKQCMPELLQTYSAERQRVAQELIDFDREFARMFSDRPVQGAGGGSHAGEGIEVQGIDPKVFQKNFVKQGRFTAGMGTHYRPSIICGESHHQHLAAGYAIGMRFHSAPVIRFSDAMPVHLGHAGKADGRWRIYAFAGAGDPMLPSSGIRQLCDFLVDAPDSPVRKFTAAAAHIDAVFDVRAIFQQAHQELQLEKLPALLLPRKGCYGLRDYEKAFCADLKNGNDIFDLRGIKRVEGCMVVVRPDQYVAHVLPLNAYQPLVEFFAGFMLEQS